MTTPSRPVLLVIAAGLLLGATAVRVSPRPGKIITSELARQLTAEFPSPAKVESFLPC